MKLPAIRLRVPLAVLAVAGSCAWTYPRAQAAWELQTVATRYADYAACMAGPTGPGLIRENLAAFRELVRRRLVAAPASDRPFSECAALARELTGNVEAEGAHRANAWSFVEYGALQTPRGAELSIERLAISTEPLRALTDNAWPFTRGDFAKLVQPSATAKEAVHPVAPPRPALARGLPNWPAHYRIVRSSEGKLLLAFGQGANLSGFESRDNGLSWRPVSTSAVEAFGGRCPAPDGGAFTLSLDESTNSVLAVSSGPDAEPAAVELAPAETSVLSTSCDGDVLVAALKNESTRAVSLSLCRFRGACSSVALPRLGGLELTRGYPIDVARVASTTVVAVTMGGIVRVASSRDDGRTWAPFAVAFDAGAHPALSADVRVPSRLLVVGSRVFLYGGASSAKQTYPILISDDQGASWRGA